MVGRGCLGRPWLFRDLAAAFAGEQVATLPTLGEVAAMMRRHAELLCQHMGEERGCKEFRKHVSWYLKGFAAGGELRRSLALVTSLRALDELLARLDPDEAFPVAELGTPRGRQGSPRRVVLPEGWLDDTDGTGTALREDARGDVGRLTRFGQIGRCVLHHHDRVEFGDGGGRHVSLDVLFRFPLSIPWLVICRGVLPPQVRVLLVHAAAGAPRPGRGPGRRGSGPGHLGRRGRLARDEDAVHVRDLDARAGACG